MVRYAHSTLLLMLISCLLQAQKPLNKDVRFVQNLGQWEGDFDFKMKLLNGAYFFNKSGYRVALVEPDHHDEEVEHFHEAWEHKKRFSFWCEFTGATHQATFVGSYPSADYHNYFLGKDSSKWKSGVPQYLAAKQVNVYPNIDLYWYSDPGTLKYDWIIKPGGNPQQITYSWKGTKVKLDPEGNLQIYTPFGNIQESKPIAYQMINGVKIDVPISFKTTDSTTSFAISKYDVNHDLIIDPQVVFSTFTGSTSDNWGFTATYDNAGNLYAGGIAFGAGYPTSSGAFDQSYNPNNAPFPVTIDAAISKFNSTGTNLLYSTYLGGSGNDQPHSMMVNASNQLVVYGATGSTDFPTTSTAFQPNFAGGFNVGVTQGSAAYHFTDGTDIFITKFSSTGSTLVGSTYLGGGNNDGLNRSLDANYGDASRGEVIVDGNDKIWITSTTYSTNFPKTNGSTLSGNCDAIIARMNSNLSSLEMSTYFGGPNSDAGYSLKVTNSHVYIAGGTTSPNLPNCTSGLNTVNQGGRDGFLAKFQLNGTSEVSTFLGTPQNDQAYFIEVDKLGAIYAFGQTKGYYPVTPATTYSTNQGSQFIHKLNSDLDATIFSTHFGTTTSIINMVPSAFEVDECLNILVSGWGGQVNAVDSYQGGTTNGLPVTSDAIKSTTDGSDFYFAVFNQNAQNLSFASFYGGTAQEHVDGGTSRFAPDGTIYQSVCAACGNGSFPTTPGVYAGTPGFSNCNLAAMKITFDVSISAVGAIDVESFIDTACSSILVKFGNNSKNADSYFWDFGNGQTSTDFEPTVVYNVLGQYTITLIAFDTVCDISDTAYFVFDNDQERQAISNFSSVFKSCDQSRKAIFTNLSKYTQKYEWDFGDGTTSNLDSPIHQYANPGSFQVVLYSMDTMCGKADTSYSTVIFDPPLPTPQVIIDGDSCADGSLAVSYINDRSGLIYKWVFPNGIDYRRNPRLALPATGIYTVYLTIEDTACNNTYDYTFNVNITKLDTRLYIPNAFTPNGDRVNDELEIAGNPCDPSAHFVIYNSFGGVVFETDRPYEEFWDGTIGGQPAQEDTYVYKYTSNSITKIGYVSTIF